MSDPTTSKPAAVQLYAMTTGGVRVPLRADASGNLVLAATIDTTNLALHTDVDGLEALVTSSNTKLDTLHTDLGTTLHADIATTVAGKLDTLHTDNAAQATAAKQDTAQTTLTAIDGHVDGLETLITATNVAIAAMQAALQDPTTYNAITPSDSTNVTSLCTKGLFVSVTGNVNITGVGGSAVSLGTQLAGTTIPGALSRVNVATTATVFGLSGP